MRLNERFVETPEWRRAYEEGVRLANEARQTAQAVRVERAKLFRALAESRMLREDRARRIREIQELAIWWDGPGTEGRTA